MNNDIEFILMTLRFEALDELNQFKKEQRDELISLVDTITDLNYDLKIPFKSAKNLKKTMSVLNEFERLFGLYGGNPEKLENRLKEIRSNKIKAIASMVK